MKVYTRGGGTEVEAIREAYGPPRGRRHGLGPPRMADARFATDIMSEHGLFFALLMPPEVANEERMQALQFASDFAELHKRIASAPDRGI